MICDTSSSPPIGTEEVPMPSRPDAIGLNQEGIYFCQESDEDEDGVMNNCPWLLDSLVRLKLTGCYSKALQVHHIHTEARCLADDFEQLINNPRSILTSKNIGGGSEVEFGSDSKWARWRRECRDGTAIEKATPKVEADPDVPSHVFDWLVCKSELLGNDFHEDLEDASPKHPWNALDILDVSPIRPSTSRNSIVPIPDILNHSNQHDSDEAMSEEPVGLRNHKDSMQRISVLSADFEAAKERRELKMQYQQRQAAVDQHHHVVSVHSDERPCHAPLIEHHHSQPAVRYQNAP
eukprot:GHVH01007416.1.p1 GENE.GHVH01007416.1~~GHVH01007416.1.p1  ORF type:complete len:293 (-),score=32.32 GHVH01007416.1:1229-2107(-)